MVHSFAIAFIIVILSTFTQGQQSRLTKTDQDAIREAVFRELIEPWSGPGSDQFRSFYLAIDNDKDPSSSLLRRLKDISVPIKSHARSYMSDGEQPRVLDKKTKEPGVRFSISKLTRAGTNQVTATGGANTGFMGLSGCSYTLEKQNNVWKITSKFGCYMS